MFTQKDDWLNSLLASNGAYVSGHPTFAVKFGIEEPTPMALRVLRFIEQREFKLSYLLTVETDDPNSITANLEFIEKLTNFLEIFGDDLVVLFFSDNQADFSRYNPSNTKLEELSSDALKQILAKNSPRLLEDIGTDKDINKTTNDAFQVWTGENLSKYCVVNDIDAFYLKEGSEGQNIFFELKRVTANLETWMPYTDDQANYTALEAMRERLGGISRIIAYNRKETELIALHFLESWSREEIIGKRLMVRPTDITTSSLGERYRSINRRQARRRR